MDLKCAREYQSFTYKCVFILLDSKDLEKIQPIIEINFKGLEDPKHD